MTPETIEYPPTGTGGRPPLLFVHGAWHGAWCWDQGFLQYCAARGWYATALSLRGHGGSPLGGSLRLVRIRDYVEDVRTVAESLRELPILIGHSMGGFVVQKYLEKYSAAGAVLLASAPPQGVWRSTLQIHLRYPWRALRMHGTRSLYPLVDSPEMVRNLFFSPSATQAQVEAVAERVQDESYRAFLDMLLFDLPRKPHLGTPVQVLGGQLDDVFPPATVRETARVYGVAAMMFPGMAHDMMLEPGWESVAQAILDWAGGLPGTVRREAA